MFYVDRTLYQTENQGVKSAYYPGDHECYQGWGRMYVVPTFAWRITGYSARSMADDNTGAERRKPPGTPRYRSPVTGVNIYGERRIAKFIAVSICKKN